MSIPQYFRIPPSAFPSEFRIPHSEFRIGSWYRARVGIDFNKAWKVAQAVFGIADLSRRALGDPGAREPAGGVVPLGGGLMGEVEARLTGVVVSALKEAFDRDAARLEAERAALEDQRRRAEEALRLELIRQAGDRVITRLRAIGTLALVTWIMSVIFAMRFPEGLAGAGRFVLGLGWVALLGSMACSFAAHARVTRWLAGAAGTRDTAADVPEGGAAAFAPWLTLAGIALVGTSLLIAL